MSHQMRCPTPHLEKLEALLLNDKLPASDRPRIEEAIARYHVWIRKLAEAVDASTGVCERLVELLNEYKLSVDIDLIYDSENDFLCRQKGQLKLDNSIIEEFLPWLMCPSLIPELGDDVVVGPVRCFSALTFSEALDKAIPGGGMRIREKDQDFAITRPIYLMASHSRDFALAVTNEISLAYVAAEVKTNLDKTMFQEACATAHDVKVAASGARYYLLCEWLDMTPLSTAATDIDEILILRGAKRVGSHIRKHFASRAGRITYRDDFVGYLHAHPFRVDIFQRFVDHVRSLLIKTDLVEDDVLTQGFF